jgi:hypothetical protein
MQHFISFYWRFTKFKAKFGIHSCSTAKKVTAAKNTTDSLNCYPGTVSDWTFGHLPIVGKR